jgi:hypothetical protein
MVVVVLVVVCPYRMVVVVLVVVCPYRMVVAAVVCNRLRNASFLLQG